MIESFDAYKHFNRDEFDSPDEVGSGSRMNPEFMQRLSDARNISIVPFKINSGYRTTAKNRKAGGVKDSSHLIGRAADIATPNSSVRFVVLNALMAVGFKRIGIGRTFIHVDDDVRKKQEIVFDYYPKRSLLSLLGFKKQDI